MPEDKVEDKPVEYKMTEEELKAALRLRELIIKTDGRQIIIEKNEMTMLELKEICREILAKAGG